MIPKPTDLLLDVTTFFAVVIPGMVLTAATLLMVHGVVPSQILAIDAVARWVAFGVATYVVGQGVFALGSWYLDPICNVTYQAWRLRLRQTLRESVKARLVAMYGRHAEETGIYPLARAFLLNSNPSGYVMIERIDADSKFFRGMAMSVLLVAAIYSRTVWTWAIPVIGLGAVVATAAVVAFALARGNVARGRWERLTALSVASATLAAIGIIAATSLYTAIAIAVLLAILFLRYSHQRWQRNETLNELVLLSFRLQDRSRAVDEARPVVAACVHLALRVEDVARSHDEAEARRILDDGNVLFKDRVPILALHDATKDLPSYLDRLLRATGELHNAVHLQMKHIREDDLNPPLTDEIRDTDTRRVREAAGAARLAADELATKSRESIAKLETLST